MNELFHSEDLSGYSFLVTGGAGFIGSHIAEYLLKNNAGNVRVLDNMANGFESNLDILRKYPAFEFIDGDIRDIDTCSRACDGVDFVSHQAALGSVPRSIKDPKSTNDVNVGGFVNMLKAATDKKVKQFVYASSSSVYGDDATSPKKEEITGHPLSPYAVSKKANELYAAVFTKAYNISVTGFRYFNIFGPRQDPNGPYAAVIPLFVSGIIRRTPVFINGDGNQTRDFTFVANAVQANIKGMLSKEPQAAGKVYNIACGENISVNNLYQEIKKYLQSDWEPQHRDPRAGDVRNSLADITLARNLLHYTPQTKFAEGLPITIDYFKKLSEK